jgi:hypothetical protein
MCRYGVYEYFILHNPFKMLFNFLWLHPVASVTMTYFWGRRQLQQCFQLFFFFFIFYFCTQLHVTSWAIIRWNIQSLMEANTPTTDPFLGQTIYTYISCSFLLCCTLFLYLNKQKTNSMVWVRERTIPTERRLSAKWLPTFADKGCHVVSVTDPSGRISRFSRREPLLFYLVAPQFVLTRLSGPRSRPTIFL